MKAEGEYQKVIMVYKKVNLLILDEWRLKPLTMELAKDLLEIIEARHLTGSTIFCTQFVPGDWQEKLSQQTLADVFSIGLCIVPTRLSLMEPFLWENSMVLKEGYIGSHHIYGDSVSSGCHALSDRNNHYRK